MVLGFLQDIRFLGSGGRTGTGDGGSADFTGVHIWQVF